MRSRWRLTARTIIAGLGVALSIPSSLMANSKAGGLNAPDPMAMYGREIRFDVLRNGREAGWHLVSFDRSGTDVTVSSTFHLQIDVLFLTVFRYRYHSQATWRDGHLDSLTVQVDDDGALSALEAAREGSRIFIKNGEEAYSVAAPLYPTDHWHPGVLGKTRVLNTLTGRVNRVTIRPAARETVATERGDITATRYTYSGELETEVWYDDSGRWVKMRFAGRDGSTIEYICRRCQGGVAREAQR